VSRTTWRVGQGFWLTRCDNERGEAFSRECSLLHALAETAKADPGLLLIVPSLIPTRSGDVVSMHSDSLWRLTRHIDGLHPSPNNPAAYDLMLNVLLRLHKAFDLTSNECPTFPNIVGRVRDRLSQLPNTISRSSFAHKERDILHEAANWLKPRLDRLSIFPTRLVHGDWTPLNVLMRCDGRAGILDFEACGRGPAVLDFANMCSTLLMWSRLDNMSERIATFVSSFGEKTGVPIGLDIIHISMLTHWVGHYFDWREREATDENTEVLRRLLGRIETVLYFAAKSADM
jgi:Ser/Thr protein kinase RdoA (MazF antagonist)